MWAGGSVVDVVLMRMPIQLLSPAFVWSISWWLLAGEESLHLFSCKVSGSLKASSIAVHRVAVAPEVDSVSIKQYWVYLLR
uniref:Uncharacterized protein n=1 Tax=Panstrongylus lignarius TaxID=156445 RepID=A0A224Y4Z0_9HEMI